MSTAYYATPADAERAFYYAFEHQNVDAMMDVWAEDESIICIHPMGPRLEGRDAVAESWQGLFSSDNPLRFERREVSCTQNGAIAIHCLYECIYLGPDFDEQAIVFATNVYRHTSLGWRMVLHHASPGQSEDEDAELDLEPLEDEDEEEFERPRLLH